MNREQFQISKPTTVNLRTYKVRSQGRCPPLINLLIVGSSLGLFAYVNTYFLVRMGHVIDGSVFDRPTPISSCDTYYCDQTAYNFIYAYSNFEQCNVGNCGNIICNGYDCTNNADYDINYYYACQPSCPGTFSQQPVPHSMVIAYILAIVTASFFGVGVLFNLLYGIIANFCSSGLTFLQRMGLLLGFVWPKLKYYAFRNRQNWELFEFNFKAMIGMEIVVNIFYAVTLALYIYLEIAGFWQTPAEIANFYMLIWAYISRITMVGESSGPFCRANAEIEQVRNNSAYI